MAVIEMLVSLLASVESFKIYLYAHIIVDASRIYKIQTRGMRNKCKRSYELILNFNSTILLRLRKKNEHLPKGDIGTILP